MRTLKVLNVIAIVLLFTPFFQMCSDDDAGGHNAVAVKESVAPDSIVIDSTLRTSTTPNDPQSTQEEGDNIPWFEDFWELITVPDDNMTMTAFGLFIQAIFQLLDGRPQDIWFGSVLAVLSMVLTLTSMVRLARRKAKGLRRLYLANVLSVIGMFISAAVTFDHLYQIRWGFYAYALVIVGMTVTTWSRHRRDVGAVS